MLKAFKGLVAVLLLGGCYTQFKAIKQVDKALARYPQIVAKIAQDSFPCNIIRIDTLISVNDTTLLLDCPVRDTISVHDTVHNTVDKKLYVKLPYKTIYITKVLESTARLVIVKASLDSAQEVVRKLGTENNDLIGKIGRKNKAIYWLIAFLVGLSVPYLFRIFKTLTIK
jgi:hypothetical protein